MSHPADNPVSALVITGPVGVGKTTAAMALGELLEAADHAHALIDMDWIRSCYPPPAHDRFHTQLGLDNLAALWRNYHAAGAQRLIIVDIVETPAMISAYQQALPGAQIVVARLHATLATIHARLEGRNTGASLRWHQARAGELLSLWAGQPVEDLLVNTEGKCVVDVARELLAQMGWARSGG